MIDVRDFKKRPDFYTRSLARRGKQFENEAKSLASLLERADSTKQQELERLRAAVNKASKEIPSLRGIEKRKKIASLKKVSQRIDKLESNIRAAQETVLQQLKDIPNVPRDDVPDGLDPSKNQVIREVGEKPKFSLQPRDYLSLAEALGIIDVHRASKVSGSRFGYLLGAAAELEFALVQYTYRTILPQGFIPVIPPVMIKDENMWAMGYLAGRGGEDAYRLEKDGLYLVGTSEQSIGPMHRDETFDGDALPRRYLGFSTCFRREAGSYGKDTRGILRVHQFDKLEMFSFTLPERSDEEHEFLLSMQEKLWKGLEIPYRIVKLCTGDLSYPSARTYDIEAWLPGQKMYREMGSTSTTTDYQSRDLNIHVRRGRKHELVHMLNGTAFAIGRTLIAIIENYQQPDGSVTIPKVLQPFMAGLKTITKT